MSTPYQTICPHCGKTISIPYKSVATHIHREHGQISAFKRKQKDPNYTRNMIIKRWADKPLHKTQQAILDLSKKHDLTTMTLREIADKVQFNGKWRENYIWRHLRQLEKKGLLPKLKRPTSLL